MLINCEIFYSQITMLNCNHIIAQFSKSGIALERKESTTVGTVDTEYKQ